VLLEKLLPEKWAAWSEEQRENFANILLSNVGNPEIVVRQKLASIFAALCLANLDQENPKLEEMLVDRMASASGDLYLSGYLLMVKSLLAEELFAICKIERLGSTLNSLFKASTNSHVRDLVIDIWRSLFTDSNWESQVKEPGPNDVSELLNLILEILEAKSYDSFFGSAATAYVDALIGFHSPMVLPKLQKIFAFVVDYLGQTDRDHLMTMNSLEIIEGALEFVDPIYIKEQLSM
jgi:hypothetical protein